MAGSSAAEPFVDAAVAEGRHGRMLVVALARSLAIVAITLTIYAFIPIRPETAVFIAAVAGLGLIVLFMNYWRRTASFLRHAYVTNVLLMTAGFVLTGYQLSGYFLA